MGQQQLLLIVLGVIIVGVAVITAIILFRASAVENKRDLILNETMNIAMMAQEYYKKPMILGGGSGSFTNWKMPPKMNQTAAGSYTANIQDQEVTLIGTGNEVVNGTDSVKVQIIVFSDSLATTVIH
ncbi:MAG: hypothetical protein IT239_05350 [Bacteroidia bacterium]|nr:hypothetical protein [Bacteroidia bacterium]